MRLASRRDGLLAGRAQWRGWLGGNVPGRRGGVPGGLIAAQEAPDRQAHEQRDDRRARQAPLADVVDREHLATGQVRAEAEATTVKPTAAKRLDSLSGASS